MALSSHIAWRIDSRELPVITGDDFQQQFFPESVGEGSSKIFQLDSELNFIQTHFKPTRDLAIISQNQFDQPRMVVTIGLKGTSRFVGQDGEVVFREGYTTITTLGSTKGERQYESDEEVSQLRFSFPQTWFDKHIGMNRAAQLFDAKGTRLITIAPTEPHALIGAQQLLSCNLDRDVTKLYMLGSAMSILATELGRLWQEKCQFPSRFTHHDQLIAQRARDILYLEFRCPPSIEELAKQTNTNSFKLKKLFHHYYNTTPYQMVLDFRMSKAHQLLLTSSLKITDIAEEVGYQHIGNFSAAFTKYFGLTPKQIANQSRRK
jgi:AraC family transcriptional activator of pyochelin receptor